MIVYVEEACRPAHRNVLVKSIHTNFSTILTFGMALVMLRGNKELLQNCEKMFCFLK